MLSPFSPNEGAKNELLACADDLPVHISSIESSPPTFTTSYYQNNVLGVAFDGYGIDSGVNVQLARIFVTASDDQTGSICLDNVDIHSQETAAIKYRVTSIVHVTRRYHVCFLIVPTAKLFFPLRFSLAGNL